LFLLLLAPEFLMFFEEEILIPFQASQLPPGPWVVFAPHADDETFGMGGTMLKAKQQKIETHLVVLTDGSKGGEGADLVEVRKSEVHQAASLLGVKSLDAWSVSDRCLEVSDEIILKTSSLILELSPAAVFFPGPLEIHPDHRAASLLVWRALQKVKSTLEPLIPVSYEISVQNPVNMLIDITSQVSEKEKVMEVYASQNKENNYPELVLALDKGRTFSLPREVQFAEGFFVYQKKDLDQSLETKTRQTIELYMRQA
jgi:LmbE family N-acetylglucosaminyl deacetylase